MAKILLVEDDVQLAEILQISLTSQGHIVQAINAGKDAAAALRVNKYDLIILDWMLPEISGLDLLRDYRAGGGHTPVLMLTARSLIGDKEQGLDSGADDYLTKPFQTRELLARVRALLRRPASTANVVLRAGELELDPVACIVKQNGKELNLRPKVYSLLEFFMRHPNQAFTAEALLERVWLDDATGTPDTVRTHIKLLRRALGEDGKLIQTLRDRGYILKS